MSGNEVSSTAGPPKRRVGVAILAVGFLLGLGAAAVLIFCFWDVIGPSQWGLHASLSPASGATVDQQKPGPPLRGRVLSADGMPVSGASVFVALPGPSNLRIRNGRIFFEDYGPSNFARATTGPNGQYLLPQQSGDYLVAAITDEGYGQLDQDAVAKDSDIRLTAWGQIEGRLMIGGKPGAGVNLRAGTEANDKGPVHISMANFAETDAEGNFEMERVVPGTVEIERDFQEKSGGNSMVFSAMIGSVQVAAGQTATLRLGGAGREVDGKFIFPPGKRPADYFINARAYATKDGGPSAITYFLQVDEQQHFRIDDCPAGDYRIHINLDRVGGDRIQEPITPVFTVPEGAAGDEPVVIPDIRLQ